MKNSIKKIAGPIILMAQTLMGMWMTDARGKSGGHVITKNRQGQAVRTKVTPSNRRSNSQQNARSRFSTYSQGWGSLSESERQSWNSAAPDFKKTNIFGNSYSPTGKNLYMLINQNLVLIGETPVTDPPVPVAPVSLLTLTLASNTDAAQTIGYTATPTGANTVCIVEATRPLSPGTFSPGSSFRKIATIAAAAASPFNSFASYTAVFGTPVTGKKIFVRVTPVDDTTGTRGIPLQTSGITA